MSYDECYTWGRVPFFNPEFSPLGPKTFKWPNQSLDMIQASAPWSTDSAETDAASDLAATASQVMERLYYWGALQTVVIQNNFPSLENPFIQVSSIFDPANVFMFLFPLTFFINLSLSTKLLVASSVTEWVNLVLKWMLHEDRPYWWAGANKLVYDVTLRQTDITCETGPGSPSGHVMTNTTVYYLLVHYLAQRQNKSRAALLWATFYATITCIGISRVYIAAHFPHQTLFGLVLGIAVAKFCNSCIKPDSWKFRSFLKFSVFLFLCGMASHWIVGHVMKIDPERSVKMAKQFCSDSSRVHVNTIPFFGFMRLVGVPMGLGLLYACPDHEKITMFLRGTIPSYQRILAGLISYGVGLVLFRMSGGQNTFIICAFALARYTLFAFIVSYVVPKIFFGSKLDTQPQSAPSTPRVVMNGGSSHRNSNGVHKKDE